MFNNIQQNDSVIVYYCKTVMIGSYKAFKKVEEVGGDYFIVGGKRFHKYNGLAVNDTSHFAPFVISVLAPHQ